MDVWHDLLEDARWAPSPHNIQPWRLRLGSNGDAALLCAAGHLLPDTDPSGRFTAVGLGCFVESLAVAAAARGLSLDAELLGGTPAGGEPYAHLRVRAKARSGFPDPALLRRRRTSRLPYDGRAVPGPVLEELAAIARSHGHALAFSSEPALVDWLLDLNARTLFLDLAEPLARAEVGAWLRFSAGEAAARRDGFSPAALGFPGWLLRLFFRRHALVELPLLRTLARRLYTRTTRGTRTVAWISGPFDRNEEWFAAGRMLAALWLAMTSHDVRLHPFGSIITNAEANRHLQERIPRGPGTLWLAMRLGYSREPPRSHRLEADELVVA